MGTSFTNPIPRGKPTRYHESSRLRVQRDSDVVPKIWQKSLSVAINTERLAQAVEQMQRELNRLRRRKGSDEVATATQNWFLGEWNDTMVVNAQQAVTFTPSGGQAGTYVCISNAPIGTEPSDGAYYVLLPYPAPGVWAF